ncbi:hypothetical protein H0H92_016126, partial [Tricholoma furcatifolium]
RTRQTLLNLDDGVDVSNEFEEPDPFSSPLGPSVDLPHADEHTTDEEVENRDGADTQEDATANPFPDPPACVRPSDYLRSRCPLCFGGLVYSNSDWPDAIVCIDACFTQKHNRQSYDDPPLSHPRSVFLSKDQVNTTETYVDALRPASTKATKRPRLELDHDDDGFEHTLRVPRSVLDG